MPVSRPRRTLLGFAGRIRSVSGGARPVCAAELVHVNVRREQVVLRSDLLHAGRRRPAGERIRRREVHHVVRQPETHFRMGSPVVRPAGAREQRGRGGAGAGGGGRRWTR